ncbi:MAG: transcriptional regulator NanR [Pseudomonadota bacterium]
MTSEKIIKRKLSDEVFDRLRQLITDGNFAPGEALPPERDLMVRFGVGRPAIREALQSLSNMGVITISHGERARVNAMTAKSVFRQFDMPGKLLLSASPKTLEDLKEARKFFELAMIRVAASKATSTDIQKLKDTLEQQRSSLGNAEAFTQADMAFHNTIAAMTGNSIYEAVSESMLNWLKAYHAEVLIWSGKENLTLIEHEKIIRCIEEGNVSEAEEAMRDHLDRSGSLYQHRFQ